MTDMPAAIAALPRNRTGYPVPYFVDRSVDRPDGEPDFRVADSRKLRDAIRFELCWVCGKRRGSFASFVIGPMCAVNRVSAEPPCHLDCAVYSATACPFLSTPNMVRRDRRLPEGMLDPAGEMILRNPGVALVWTSRTFQPVRHESGILWDIGEPVDAQWYARGWHAEPAEIRASLQSGLPILRAAAEKDGPAAVAQLQRDYQAVVDRWCTDDAS